MSDPGSISSTDIVAAGTPPLTPPATLGSPDEDVEIPDAQDAADEDNQRDAPSSSESAESEEEASDLDGPYNFKLFSDQAPFGYNRKPTDSFDRISDLPDETLLDIFTIARMPSRMRGSPSSYCAPLSKRLLRITQKALYARVRLDHTGDKQLELLDLFLQTITDNPGLAVFVLDLTINQAGNREPDLHKQRLRERILNRLPNLRRLATYAGLETAGITSIRGVLNPAWLAIPRPALRHLELELSFGHETSKVVDLINTQPLLVSLRIPLGIHACKWPRDVDVATASLAPSSVRTLGVEVIGQEHRFLQEFSGTTKRLLAHVCDLRLVDHESDNRDLSDDLPPPSHRWLLAANTNITALNISTTHPAINYAPLPPGILSQDTPSEGGTDNAGSVPEYEDWYKDETHPRSRFALNTILTRFPLLTSLTLDGAAVDDRDLSFLLSLPLLQRLSFGPLFDLRLENVVEIIQAGAYPPALRELAVFVNRPFTSRPMWTGRRNLVDAKRLLEVVEGTRVRIGGDLRGAVDCQERWDELESDSDDTTDSEVEMASAPGSDDEESD